MQVEFRRIQGLRAYQVMVVRPDEDDFAVSPSVLQNDLARRVQEHEVTVDAVLIRATSRLPAPRGHGGHRASSNGDAGYHICRAALAAWSLLFSRELLAVIRVELRPWQLSTVREGTWRLLQELERRCSTGDPVAVVEARSARRWLDEALGFWGLDLHAALEEWLPRHLDALERRRFDRSRAVTEPLPSGVPLR